MMSTQEKVVPTLIYLSGTHVGLGPGWDVMHVVQKELGITTGSVVLARDMNGNIIRQIGFFPDEWERITDEQTLRASQQCFDSRDRLLAARPESLQSPA